MTRKFRLTPEEVAVIRRLCKRNPKNPERWQGVSEAVAQIDNMRGQVGSITRQTLYDYLKAHPEEDRPRSIQPKYASEYKKTEGARLTEEYITKYSNIRPELKPRAIRLTQTFGEKAFLLLNKKDPISWTEDDYFKIAAAKEFLDKKTGLMAYDQNASMRRIMRATGKYDLQTKFGTKTLKRAAGQKRQWWLRKEEVIAIADAFDALDGRTLFLVACATGSRINTYLSSTWNDVDLDLGTWHMYETKTSEPVTKILSPSVVRRMKFYREQLEKHDRAKPTDKVFPASYTFYSKMFKDAAIKSGLCRTGPDPNTGKTVDDLMHGHRVSWHMTRHTFASHLAQAGVAMQHIMNQGPWSDSATLLKYYAAIDSGKLREDMSKIDFG